MSKIDFVHNECIVRKDGIRSGESITFGGAIGTKRIESSLPDNYYPDY